jgi:membrane-bound lytic murein transglycosylase D
MKTVRFTLLLAIVMMATSCASSKMTVQAPVFKQSPEQETLEPELSKPSPPRVAEGALTHQERTALESEGRINFSNAPHAQKMIKDQFLFLSRDVRFKLQNWIVRSERYLPYIRKVFNERGLPEELACLAYIESGYNPKAYSRSGAAGVWQFMPFTGRRFNLTVDWWLDERRDVYKATHAAADYLTKLYELFGNWSLAIAAYNAGEGKIGRAIKATGAKDFFELVQRNHTLDHKQALREETLHYVPRFAAMVKIFNNLELLGFKPVDWNKAPDLRALAVPGGTDIAGLIKASGMDKESFENHNGAFRRETTPPSQVTTVYIPIRAIAAVKDYVQNPGARKFAGYQNYTVRRGDSWSVIAQRTGVDVATLKGVNNAKSNLIHSGQRIVIPGKGSDGQPQRAVAKSSASASSPVRTHATTAQSKPATGSSSNYKVRAGDTLYSLAKRFNRDVSSLLAVNNMRSARELRAGQVLRIPGGAQASRVASNGTQGSSLLYRVRSGDTVWSIARQFSVSPHNLMQWNKLSMATVIKPGDHIKVHLN